MLTLRLKQAETALKHGRLDEAFDLLHGSETLRQHRRGQALLGRLTQQLAARGRDHLTAGRLQEALADCNKADKLSGNLEPIAQLRKDVCELIEQRQHQEQKQQAQYARARRQLDQGRLSVGEQLLLGMNGQAAQAELLKDQAAARRLEIGSIVAQAEQALAAHDLETALALVSPVARAVLSDSALARIVGTIKEMGVQRVTHDLNQGRIDLADQWLRCIEVLPDPGTRVQELRRAVHYCHQVTIALTASELGTARETLQKLRLVLPEAVWLSEAVDQMQSASEALHRLRTGPLGLISSDYGLTDDITLKKTFIESPPPLPRNGMERTPETDRPTVMPKRFIMQIDGVGSFLVLTQDTVNVGPISSSAQPAGAGKPDLALLAHPHLPCVTIARQDGDYLLRSSKTVHIDGRVTTDKLLSDGDRIQLSDKCRLRFNLPNAASTSATLVLSGTRLPRPDIHYCILMDGEILIGPGSHHHIRADHLDHTIALVWRNGRLICSNGRVVMNNQSGATSRMLPMNTPIQIEGLTLVLTDYDG